MANEIMMETIRSFESRPEKTYEPGEQIFAEGEPGSCMFGVIEGEVEFQLEGQIIETLQKGELFGVGAIVGKEHFRASSAIAKAQCRIAELDRSHFLFAVQQTPMFALEVMRTYSERYRRLKALYKEVVSQS